MAALGETTGNEMIYKRNKLKTAWDITRKIENWPTAIGLRLRRNQPGLRLLRLRGGLNIVCRGATRDWDVIHELFFAAGYGRAMDYLKSRSGHPLVLDLGGNIGLFSLLAASTLPTGRVIAFEPGPPNYRLFDINRLANPAFTDRIELRKEAVAGRTRTMEWTFDEANPGGSSLYASSGARFAVQIRAFAEVMDSLPGQVALAKIDIEGAEYELLAESPQELWQRIDAISLELHDDPGGRIRQEDFIKSLAAHGFHVQEESVCSYFLHR
jgi:FkbM family methyltransferase